MTKFAEQPAIIELFGHKVVAGFIAEEEHLGTTMLRVDVPAVGDNSPFTKFYNASAVYGITPTDEATMLLAARQTMARPISIYIMPERQLAERVDDYDEERL